MSHELRKRLKFMYSFRIIRNGIAVQEVKRARDLLVWRGQTILANLLSQNEVGTSTTTWKVIASSNNTSPNMGDDSGNPENNEFNPTLGTPATVEYFFEPETKPSAETQTYAHLRVKGSIIVTVSETLRKIGIIDDIDVPNRHIIVEDAIVPVDVFVDDVIEIEYWMPLF